MVSRAASTFLRPRARLWAKHSTASRAASSTSKAKGRWRPIFSVATEILREPSSRLRRALGPALHQRVRGTGFVEELPRGIDAGDRQTRRVEQSDLHEHARLIPVDMLVIELVAAEIDDRDGGHFDILAGRRHTRKHPVDLDIMRKTDQHLVDKTVRADRARDWYQPEVGGAFRDEVVRVETRQFLAADAAGDDRDVVDIRFGHHRAHRRGDIARGEFVGRMLLPEGLEVIMRPHRPAQQRDRARMRKTGRGPVVARPAPAVEAGRNPRIDIDRDIRAVGEGFLYPRCRARWDLRIVLGQMDDQWTADA